MRREASARAAVGYATVAALVVLLGVVLAPFLESWSGVRPSALRLVYAPLCHQIAERSLFVFGAPLAVCARCTGLYLGAMLGLALAKRLGVGRAAAVRRAWLGALVLPTLVDGALALLGLSPLADVPRFLLAIPAGGAAGMLLAVGIHDLVLLVADRLGVRSAPERGAVEESR
jgi:uncharacterized membrane protein